MYKWLIFCLFLAGCSREVYDYEIKDAYIKCSDKLYSIDVVDNLNYVAHCSDGMRFMLKRNP